jgi:hypothetical protein
LQSNLDLTQELSAARSHYQHEAGGKRKEKGFELKGTVEWNLNPYQAFSMGRTRLQGMVCIALEDAKKRRYTLSSTSPVSCQSFPLAELVEKQMTNQLGKLCSLLASAQLLRDTRKLEPRAFSPNLCSTPSPQLMA